MFRCLKLLATLTAVVAVATTAGAMSFTLTRLTDNATDERTSQVERYLALDVLGRPHIVFTGSSPSGYEGVFHTWDHAGWQIQTIAADTMPNRSPVVGCGPDGRTHVLHCHWTGEGATVEHVAVLADSLGTSEPAFEDGYFDSPSLAVGPDDVLHAVCSSYWGTAYARRDAAGWSPAETIAAGRTASIALDSLLECHVVYEDVDSTWASQVWYLYGTAGNWSAPEWLAGGNRRSARNASLTVAPDGRVFVVYENDTGTDIGIELRVRAGGTWSSPEWVGPGFGPSVALDPAGEPYVAHWGAWGTDGVLLSFRQALPGWAQVTVDSIAHPWGEVLTRVGLAIDAEGCIHVAYCSRDERGGEDSELWHAQADPATDVAGLQLQLGPRFVSLANPARGSVRFRFEAGGTGQHAARGVRRTRAAGAPGAARRLGSGDARGALGRAQRRSSAPGRGRLCAAALDGRGERRRQARRREVKRASRSSTGGSHGEQDGGNGVHADGDGHSPASARSSLARRTISSRPMVRYFSGSRLRLVHSSTATRFCNSISVGIGRRDEVLEGGLEVLHIDRRVVLQGALHRRADEHRLDVGAGEGAGVLQEQLLGFWGIDLHAGLLLHRAQADRAARLRSRGRRARCAPRRVPAA